MLSVETERCLRDAVLRTQIVLARGIRCHVVVRDRMVYDTATTSRGTPAADWATLYVTLRGRFQTAGVTRTSPVAFLMTTSEFENATPGGPTFRSWGAPALIIDILVPRPEVTRPIGLAHGPLELAPATWVELERVGAAMLARDSVEPLLEVALARLADDGLLLPATAANARMEPTPSMRRLWEAARDRFGTIATTTGLQEIADSAGISLSQAGRDAAQFMEMFPYLATTFREQILQFRLRVAAQFLTAAGATATEVAALVGYGSLIAMGRAFRDAGLPPPSRYAKELGYERVASQKHSAWQ